MANSPYPTRARWLAVLAAAWLMALAPQPALALRPAPAHGCAGGRFVATVEAVQRQNRFEYTHTVYEGQETRWQAPRWLGQLTLLHASQGFLLSGEEHLDRWSRVTVPPSLTLTTRVFGRHIYWPMQLPVFKHTEACRDADGRLYVR